MKRNISFLSLTLLATLLAALLCPRAASAGGWEVDPSGFRYGMQLYADVTYADGAPVDFSAYEMGAFVGTECRGVAEALELPDGKRCLSMRIRSNADSGESVSFMLRDRDSDETIPIPDYSLDFESGKIVGLPSSPEVIVFYFYYNLSYKVDGETVATESVREKSPVTPLEEPTREGHTFSGWQGLPSTMPSRDVTATGAFSINSYRLTYTLDGETYNTRDVVYGTDISPMEAPSREGHTFSGWSGEPASMPGHDVTVAGSFVVNSYTLTYLIDGEPYKSLVMEYGSAVTPEADPVREGHSFSGWQGMPATMPARDVTVNGSFSTNPYILTYMLDGSLYRQTELHYGDAVQPEPEPEKAGHTFSGWQGLPATMPARDVTVNGSFAVDSYTLTYILDGAPYKTFSVEYGAEIIPEAEPVREGYTFSGWKNLPDRMPAADVTAEGAFTVNGYKLSYVVDGEPYRVITVETGEKIIPEAEPQKEGHTFSGWQGLPTTMPPRDVTVKGSFSLNSYTLAYSVDGAPYKTLSIDYGADIIPEPDPVKEGHSFSGWQGLPATMPARDVTVNGSFSVSSYSLTYILDGKPYMTLTLEYGATIIPETDPVREGHSFSGWQGLPATMPARDVTVNGSFTVDSYTLTYILDGAPYKTFSVEYGAEIIPEAEPVREGYTFSGWKNLPDRMPAADVTAEGAFTVNGYKLSYVVDGKPYRVIIVETGEKIIPEAEPQKEGHTFSGWQGLPTTMPPRDVTVNGSFSLNSYTLAYSVDGAPYKTLSIDYGADIIPEPDPVREGHSFSGWQGLPATMPARDVTVNGSFAVDSYTLTYILDGKPYRTLTLEYGATIIPETDPVREGHSFSGWQGLPATMPARDVTVNGSFAVDSYTLTYILDGAPYKTLSVEYGAEIIPEAEPVREGYTFSGWKNLPDRMPAADVTAEGAFTVNGYKLSYVVDGKPYRVIIVETGEKIIPEAEPQKEGHTFSGWQGLPATMPAKDITVTGSFTINSHMLTYILDGEPYKTVTLDFGTEIIPEADPQKEGFTFSGWSGFPAGMTMPDADVTVTGFLSEISSYWLNYYIDEEPYKSLKIKPGEIITPEADPVKEGHSFSGWSEIPATMPDRNVEVYGSFLRNSYDVTFVIEGETFKTMSVAYGDSIAYPDVPQREGHAFAGWESLPPTMPAHDLTVSGSYTRLSYLLSYELDGKPYKSLTILYGERIVAEPAPVAEGMMFSGWEGLPADMLMPARDLTVTGSMLSQSYELTLYIDGELYSSEKVPFGAQLDLDNPEVAPGRVFLGWDEEVPPTMPAHDLTLHGRTTVDVGVDGINGEEESVTVHDLDGRLLFRDLPLSRLHEVIDPGIYIINGRRILVK